MRIGELAQRAGVSTKAVRYYERLGLVTPGRASNGYREYDDRHLRAVAEIRKLAASGIPARKTVPFLECLELVIRDGVIEHAFYPIFPPSTHAQQVLTWLQSNPAQ